MSLRDKYTDEEWTALEAKIDFNTPFRISSKEDFKYQKVDILSDGDGHDYIVPSHLNLKKKFYDLINDENYGEFEKIFGQYIDEGSVEFYIKKS